jgi:hypothetical protein
MEAGMDNIIKLETDTGFEKCIFEFSWSRWW